jgi:hypothetical protein
MTSYRQRAVALVLEGCREGVEERRSTPVDDGFKGRRCGAS